jgi:PhoPQ-activated pathogenicity-related protein
MTSLRHKIAHSRQSLHTVLSAQLLTPRLWYSSAHHDFRCACKVRQHEHQLDSGSEWVEQLFADG